MQRCAVVILLTLATSSIACSRRPAPACPAPAPPERIPVAVPIGQCPLPSTPLPAMPARSPCSGSGLAICYADADAWALVEFVDAALALDHARRECQARPAQPAPEKPTP